MTNELSIVLYAVGSRFVAEVEESCRGLDLKIAAAVRNVEGAHYLLDPTPLCELANIDKRLKQLPCIVPLFTPVNRYKATQEAIAHGFTVAPALIDATAIVASSAVIGKGSYINSGVVIGAATRLGNHVIVNRGSSIGHHVELSDYVSLGPSANLCGETRIGRGTMVGTGAIILPKIEIGAGCIIGAGAVVTKNIPDRSLAIGNPARVTDNHLPLFDDLSQSARSAIKGRV